VTKAIDIDTHKLHTSTAVDQQRIALTGQYRSLAQQAQLPPNRAPPDRI